jgi:hypothetical protein
MTQEWEEDLRFARLSIDDLGELARSWRQRAQEGDATSSAVAKALESVVRQRRAWAPLRQAARLLRR